MTILILLLGLVLSHFLPAIGEWRRFRPWMVAIDSFSQALPRLAWSAMLGVVLLALSVTWLAGWILVGLFGHFGWLFLALVVFLYVLGPRDLDHDVGLLVDDPADMNAGEARVALRLGQHDNAETACSRVMAAAVERWFAPVFWFVLLGPGGAMIYRLAERTLAESALDDTKARWVIRLKVVMEWPVLFLVVLAAALTTDFDRVTQAWFAHRRSRLGWVLTRGLLDDVASRLVEHGLPLEGGLSRGLELAWRMLILWLVVLSLLLLAGWLA